MTASRRRFLQRAGGFGATAAASALARPRLAPGAPQAAALPPLAVIALNRMGYGPRPGDVEAFDALGATPAARLQAYVEQQLAPDAIDDSACEARVASAQLKIRYDAVHELRPLAALGTPVPELWALRTQHYQEYQRPFREVRVAAVLRAVYSRRQLKELLVEFWHNHFNVNASSESAIACTFPAYDRIMRAHCLGRFRDLLEAVGRSAAMMYYLDNVSNRISGGEGGNENYARELFELHTLGSDNYLKFYSDRSQIGTVSYGGRTYARGYIDDDVYDAAECFTGWTVANRTGLNTGEFLYDPTWHYNGDKTVLSTDGRANIPAKQPDEKDGRDVYDILAGHPGTARYLCAKLCRRLVADEPPAALVEAAVKVWMDNIDAPDQIARVVRAILLSAEFQSTWGRKIKRPFELIVGYLRATGAELANDLIDPADPGKGGNWDEFFARLGETGQRIFEWGPPTGHPDTASYWASTNGMLRRWNLPYVVAQPSGGGAVIGLAAQTNMGATCAQIVDFWIGRLCGFAIDPAVRAELIAFMAQGGDPAQPPAPTPKAPDWSDPKALGDRLAAMVQLLAMCPDYQVR